MSGSIITVKYSPRNWLKRSSTSITRFPCKTWVSMSSLTPQHAISCYSCRSARPKHCEPTRVYLIIGKPFTDFALEHHPRQSNRLTKEEAIQLLREEHQRGHMHNAFFKEDRLNCFYVICNCCPCCCGELEAMLKYHNPMIASSGYVAQVDSGLCIACGVRVESCPPAHWQRIQKWL